MKNSALQLFLTATDAAAELGLTTCRMYQLIHSNRVIAYKHGRDWLVPKSELVRYAESPKDPRGRKPNSMKQPGHLGF